MKKNTTISFEHSSLTVLRGILLVRYNNYFIVYSPGEITTWYKKENDKYAIREGCRRKCHNILEFDEYLENSKSSTYKLSSDISEYELSNNIVTLYYEKYEKIFAKDSAGVELKGIILGSLQGTSMKIEDTTEFDRTLYVIYDGTKISLWEFEGVRSNYGLSMKYPSILKELYIYTIFNDPYLDKYIGKPLFEKNLDKIDYFKLDEDNKKKILELKKMRDKNMLDYRIEKITGYLNDNNLLEESLSLSESVGNIKSSEILYNLIELLKNE